VEFDKMEKAVGEVDERWIVWRNCSLAPMVVIKREWKEGVTEGGQDDVEDVKVILSADLAGDAALLEEVGFDRGMRDYLLFLSSGESLCGLWGEEDLHIFPKARAI
jgi:hypothetical protein